MAGDLGFPCIEVAVAVITQGPKILAVYNPLWSSFTLPMTKRRTWEDPNVPPENKEEEDWLEAAARAAGEWLGQTFTIAPQKLIEIPEWRQSDRDGVWKRYSFQVFQIPLESNQGPRPGAVCQWLTVNEWLDPQRRPISPTARYLTQQLQAAAALEGRTFP
jgi:hypothetical protein